MLENHHLDENVINNEIERIRILFEKNKFDLEEKKYFLEAKLIKAKKTNDVYLLEVINRLLDEISERKITRVVAALIEKDGKYLIARRLYGNAETINKWEFPGGKVENNESEEDAIVREIKEEFEMEVKCMGFVTNNICKYPERTIDLRLYKCMYVSGDFHLHDHSEYKYVSKDDLTSYDLCPADIPLAEYVKKIKV